MPSGGTFGPTKRTSPCRIMTTRPSSHNERKNQNAQEIIRRDSGCRRLAADRGAGGCRRLALLGLQLYQQSVSNQLSAQRITFPAATAFAQAKPGTEITPGMIPYLEKYAGQQMTTGAQAEAYANHFIAVHLQEIGKGKTYSELSGAAMALPKGSAAYTSAEATVQTVFQGTTLRSMLLNAYGWWQMGQIALIASIVSFALAA